MKERRNRKKIASRFCLDSGKREHDTECNNIHKRKFCISLPGILMCM